MLLERIIGVFTLNRQVFADIEHDESANGGSLGFRRKSPYLVGSGGESPIPFQIQIQALEQGLDAQDTVTATFERLEPVVETLNKTAATSIAEVVGNLYAPIV